MAIPVNWKKVLVGVVVAAVLGAVVYASLRMERRPKAKRVYTEEAERRSISRIVKATGQIDPRVKVEISSPLIARIERLYFEEGDEIDKGQAFLELEREAFRAARDSARASLSIAESRFRQAEINLADAELKLRRARRLAEVAIAAETDLEAAELHYRSSQLGVEQAREAVIQARAALDKAEDDLSKTTIFSPLSGRIVALHAEEGEVVVSGTMNNPASVIATIADLSEILVEVDVDETEVAFVELSQEASIEVDALPDRSFPGKVVEIGSSGSNRPQQPDVTYFKVKILLESPDAKLRPGMSARAAIETATSSDAVVVPVQAVVQRPPVSEEGDDAGRASAGADTPDEVPVIFVVIDDEARQRPVETGIADVTHVEILSGLEVGASVVTGPYRALRDLEHGDPLRIREWGDERSDEAEET